MSYNLLCSLIHEFHCQWAYGGVKQSALTLVDGLTLLPRLPPPLPTKNKSDYTFLVL